MHKFNMKNQIKILTSIITIALSATIGVFYSVVIDASEPTLKDDEPPHLPLTVGNNALYPLSTTAYLKVTKEINIMATAYSSTVDQTDDTPFITASNTRVRDGIVAANFLPFGTKIRIPEFYGDKVFVVEDRMNWKKSNYHFDVWFSSYWDAKNFGAKRTYIEVLES